MESSYQKLIVWQKSMHLVTQIYKLTQDFPKDERYGLTSQMRRCAVSIPSNIAEGSQRKTQKQFSYFIDISLGSSAELETQIIIANNLGYLESEEQFRKAIADTIEVRKMLFGLQNKLQ